MGRPRRSGSSASDPWRREDEISRVFNQKLRPELGWKFFRRGPDDWSFIPGSLLRETTSNNVFKNGTAGVHYAIGWTGLADMVERYGEDYAPTMVATPPEEYPPAKRRRITVSPPDQEDDDETVAFGRPADIIADVTNNNDGPPVAALVQAIDQVNEATNNDPPPANVQVIAVAEDQANALLPPLESPTTVASVLDCLQKCTDVLSRLDNPNFQTHLQSAACKDQMWRTIETLNARLAIFNNNNARL